MTMHLAHPVFTMTGKRKGKQKFRNAEEARKARELAEQWEQNQAKWKAMSKPVTKTVKPVKVVVTPSIPVGRETQKIPSLNSWVTGAVNVKPTQHYTGNRIIGISQMAKSNAVPVFNTEHIVEIARMRRG